MVLIFYDCRESRIVTNDTEIHLVKNGINIIDVYRILAPQSCLCLGRRKLVD
jgi:hypothetical protein